MTRATVSGRPAVNPEDAPVPDPAKRPDGQHTDHWVLDEEERAKGFVRPLRLAYRHVGPPGPTHPLRPLTQEQRDRYPDEGYVMFEPYPEGSAALGRYWTQEQLDAVGVGCGTVTTMPKAVAETYARCPTYYGVTFCCGCGTYRHVGPRGEFVWEGTEERVGT